MNSASTALSAALVFNPSNNPVFAHFADIRAASLCMFFHQEAALSNKELILDILFVFCFKLLIKLFQPIFAFLQMHRLTQRLVF